MVKCKIHFVFLSCLILLGCRKNESASGGKASINGFVELTGTVNGVYVNSARINRNTVVYIKYDATEFPGTDPSQYDNQQTVDSKGNFNFQLMFKGSYYLYATGDYFDASGYYYQVAGGTQVNINTRKATLNYDIAVAVVKP